jgi:uncharacterized DUF497 family protein
MAKVRAGPDGTRRPCSDACTEGEHRFVAVGRDALGRLLTVAYTYREPDAIRIISARPATKKERQAYET